LLCLVICCWTVGKGVGQNTGKQPLAFEDFFHGKMEKISGIFPVYCDSAKVYMEIPEHLLGRELEIRAQVNKGFDMVARPLESMGVVYLQKVDGHSIYVQRRLFSERVANKNNELYEALCKSNKQPVDIVYPVVAYSAGGKGYIIDVTEMLKTGDDWFKVAAPQVRDQDVSRARITGVHEFPDGVSFTIHRMYGFSPERLLDNVIPPRGFLPLEIGCVVTLLPEREMRERFVDRRFGYHVISFLDYSQNPYRAEKDSIIRKWNLGITEGSRGEYRKGKLVNPSHPLVFYIDTCCPSEFVPYIKEGVLAWNAAFEKAGFKNALRVKMADSETVLEEQRAVIAYDLSEAGIRTGYTFHPKTGEILSCRVNIGHGFLPKELWRYLLECGTVDERIRKDVFHPDVAGEILRSKMTRAVGSVLGLKENLAGSVAYTAEEVKNVTWLKARGYTASIMDNNPYNYAVQKSDKVTVKELMPRLGEYDYLAIEWGYREFPASKNAYMDREALWKTFQGYSAGYMFPVSQGIEVRAGDLSSEPLKTLGYALNNLLRLNTSLGSIVYSDKQYDSGRAIMEANRQLIDKYGEYLLQIVSWFGEKRGNTPLSIEEQREAMALLGEYLFAGDKGLVSPLAKGCSWDIKAIYIRQMTAVFQKLLAPKVMKRMLDMEQICLENIYTADMFFKDLFSRLFCDFKADSEVSFSRMDMQVVCVNTLLESVADASVPVVKWKLQELGERLKALAGQHEDGAVRKLYAMLSSRIEKVLNK
jgi:hypothetical protein